MALLQSLLYECYSRAIATEAVAEKKESFSSRVYNEFLKEIADDSITSRDSLPVITSERFEKLTEYEQMKLCRFTLSLFESNVLITPEEPTPYEETEKETHYEYITNRLVKLESLPFDYILYTEMLLLRVYSRGEPLESIVTFDGNLHFPQLGITLSPPGSENVNDEFLMSLIMWYKRDLPVEGDNVGSSEVMGVEA